MTVEIRLILLFNKCFYYLSVSLGTISIMSFGLKVSALSMNLFARIAFNPNGGLRPMIYRIEVS